MKTRLENANQPEDADQLDEIVEAFERAWQPSDPELLVQWVNSNPACHDIGVLVGIGSGGYWPSIFDRAGRRAASLFQTVPAAAGVACGESSCLF